MPSVPALNSSIRQKGNPSPLRLFSNSTEPSGLFTLILVFRMLLPPVAITRNACPGCGFSGETSIAVTICVASELSGSSIDSTEGLDVDLVFSTAERFPQENRPKKIAAENALSHTRTVIPSMIFLFFNRDKDRRNKDRLKVLLVPN